MARGIVIEAELDKGRGVVASILVQKGTLHVGDSVAAGSSHGKIRAMINDKDKSIKEAGPSVPVEILGLNEVPNAGEIIMAFGNEKEARSFSRDIHQLKEGRSCLMSTKHQRYTLDDLFEPDSGWYILRNLILLSRLTYRVLLRLLSQVLIRLSNDEVVVKVIHGGVGDCQLNPTLVLASASNAIIIGI